MPSDESFLESLSDKQLQPFSLPVAATIMPSSSSLDVKASAAGPMFSTRTQIRTIQEHPYTSLVLSGGGVKGLMYLGVLRGLVENGFFALIEHFTGTSAGALSATAMAFGIAPDKLEEKMTQQNFLKLLGSGIGIGDKFQIQRDGEGIRNLIKGIIQEQLLEYFKSEEYPRDEDRLYDMLKISTGAEEVAYYRELWKFLKILYAQVQDVEEREKIDLSFADLHNLSLIAPYRFKYLTITVTTVDGTEMMVLNAENSPHTKIADACVASAAIPVIVKTQIVEGKRVADGGVADNVAIRAAPQSEKTRHLVCVFRNAKADLALHGSPNSSPVIITGREMKIDERLQYWLGFTGPFMHEKMRETYDVLRDHALDVINLDHAWIETHSFQEGEKHLKFLINMGRVQVERFFLNQDMHPCIDASLAILMQELVLEFYKKLVTESSVGHKNKLIIDNPKLKELMVICEEINAQLKDNSLVNPEQFMSRIMDCAESIAVPKDPEMGSRMLLEQLRQTNSAEIDALFKIDIHDVNLTMEGFKEQKRIILATHSEYPARSIPYSTQSREVAACAPNSAQEDYVAGANSPVYKGKGLETGSEKENLRKRQRPRVVSERQAASLAFFSQSASRAHDKQKEEPQTGSDTILRLSSRPRSTLLEMR